MIHPSARWRFVQQIEDKGYFEDDLVAHTLTGLRAVRRAYSEKFTLDIVARDAVLEQLRLASKTRSTALPVVFASEMVQDRLTVIMELVEGTHVRDLMAKQRFGKSRDWVEFAVNLVEEMLEARAVGARFDRITLDQILLYHTGEIRLTHRFPVGRINRKQIAESQFLERLEALEGGGVYTSEDPPNEAVELDALREILVKVASSNLKNTYQQLRTEVAKNPHLYPTKLAGIENGIANILVRMPPDPLEYPLISSLDELRDAILNLKSELQSFATMPMSPGGVAQPSSDPPSAGGYGASASGPGEGSRPPKSLYTVDLGGGTPPDPASGAGALPGSGIRKGRTPPPPSQPQPRPQRAAASSSRDFEDDNPYTSGAETGSVVPAATPRLDPPSSASFVPPVKKPAVARRASRLPVSKALVVRLLLGLVVIGLVIAAIIVLPPLLATPPPNQPPIAAVKELEKSAFAVNEEINLDGSPSSDPENDDLSYNWSVAEPADTTAIFTDPQTNRVADSQVMITKGPGVTLQIQSPGVYTLVLRVHDGKRYSDPINISITVRTANQ